MTVEAISPAFELEFMQWVSERNPHIPLSELAFLMGLPSSFDDDRRATICWRLSHE